MPTNNLLLYRRSRVPGPVSGVIVAAPGANGLAVCPRPRLRLPGGVGAIPLQGAQDFDAWLSARTPFTVVGNGTEGTFEAWLDGRTPFNQLV